MSIKTFVDNVIYYNKDTYKKAIKRTKILQTSQSLVYFATLLIMIGVFGLIFLDIRYTTKK